MDPTRYAILSLPQDTLEASGVDITEHLRDACGLSFTRINIPNFKIGTLDALVQQADELAKLDTICRGVIGKVADSFKNIMGDDEERLARYKLINDKPANQFISSFSWNTVRYRIERPLSDLLNNLHKEINAADSQVRTKTSQYQAAKAALVALNRKQNGTLATRSLASLIDATVLVQNSEFIETHLIVVPISSEKTFFTSYETLAPMVVPRSAAVVTRDTEFVLFSVSTFKKHSNDFLSRCRDNRWTPRPFRFTEGCHENERREIDEATNQEAKLLNDLLRITRTSWAEAITIWIHVLMLQIFVEDVLRYGLPLRYISHIVESTSKLVPKLRKNLAKVLSPLSGLTSSSNHAEVSRSGNDAAFMSDLVSLGVQPDDDLADQAFVYREFFLP